MGEEVVPVIVSVAEDHLDRIADLAERLSGSGLRVQQILKTLGTITGRIPRSKVAEIGRLEGVASVEPEHTIQLPPPDSPVQ